jgi:hypothetical protein
LVDVLGVVEELDDPDVDVVEVLGVVAALLEAALRTVVPAAPPSIDAATTSASVRRLGFVIDPPLGRSTFTP